MPVATPGARASRLQRRRTRPLAQHARGHWRHLEPTGIERDRPDHRYKVYRGDASGAETYARDTGNVLSCTDTTAVNGGTYCLPGRGPERRRRGPAFGRAIGAAGDRAERPATLRPAGTGRAAQPQVVGAELEAARRSPDTGSTAPRVGRRGLHRQRGANASSYADKTTTKGVRYYYWMTAVNVLGVGQPSNEANAVAK